MDLYILELASDKLRRLTNDYYDDRDPDISPDGKYIVFLQTEPHLAMKAVTIFFC